MAIVLVGLVGAGVRSKPAVMRAAAGAGRCRDDRLTRRGAPRPDVPRAAGSGAGHRRPGARGGPRGPRPLLSRGAPARRRGGPQAARADRARRRPAHDLGLGVRRGRRGLLRPARASGCGSSRARHPARWPKWCSRTNSTTRSRISASGWRSIADATDDAALARLALVEGTAMLVMQEYLLRTSAPTRRWAAARQRRSRTGPDLPKFLQDQLIFPYLGGLQFAPALRQQGGGAWTLARPGGAIAARPGEHRADPAPGEVGRGRESRCACGWTCPRRRLASRDRRHLGRVADGAARRRLDAAGWGGDRYELWQRGECAAPPCRSEDVLVMRWRGTRPRPRASSRTKLRAAPVASGRRRRGGFPRRHRHARAGSDQARSRVTSASDA